MKIRSVAGDEGTLHELVRLVYDAALDPANWDLFLEKFSLAVNGPCTALGIHDFTDSSGSAARSVGLDPYWAKRYQEYYSSVNLWMKKAPQLLVPGVVAQTQQAATDEELERSEFYSDYLRPQGLFYCFGGTVGREREVVSFLTSFRSRRAGPFGEAEISLVKHLMPHLECGLRVHSKISGLEDRLNSTASMLDLLPWALVLFDSQQRPVLTNRAADAIFQQRDGLSLTPEGVGATSHELTQRIRRAVGSSIERSRGRGPAAHGAVLSIPRPSFRRPYEFLVIPVQGENRPKEAPSVVAAVLISDPESVSPADTEALQTLYRLTAAEARLASALMQGKTVEEAAEEFEISVNTARGHLRSILSKTQTKRQSELLKQLMNSVARARSKHA